MAEPALLQRSVRLEPVPASAGDARRLVRAALSEVGAESLAGAAELAVSELVTNAVLHAATAVELTIEVTAGNVTVWVRDQHPQLPVPRDRSDSATSGRGLAIVSAVTDEYGIDLEQPAGKAVWFRLLRPN